MWKKKTSLGFLLFLRKSSSICVSLSSKCTSVELNIYLIFPWYQTVCQRCIQKIVHTKKNHAKRYISSFLMSGTCIFARFLIWYHTERYTKTQAHSEASKMICHVNVYLHYRLCSHSIYVCYIEWIIQFYFTQCLCFLKITHL